MNQDLPAKTAVQFAAAALSGLNEDHPLLPSLVEVVQLRLVP